MMPQTSGLDNLAALRQNKPACPFLKITRKDTKALVVESMRLGASDFLVKPFHSADLTAKVERLIHDINID
jgi:DNA-binding response OmpR family regulator